MNVFRFTGSGILICGNLLDGPFGVFEVVDSVSFASWIKGFQGEEKMKGKKIVIAVDRLL